MERFEQRVLIYSQSTELIDLAVDLCEESSQTHLRVMVVANQADLEDLFEHHSCSLALVDLDNCPDLALLDQIALTLSPKPTIAITSGSDSETLLNALRNGADSVFTRAELEGDTRKLVYSLDRHLQRAAAIENANYLRDSLSQSLEELKADQNAARQIQVRLLPPADQMIGDLHCRYLLQPSLLLSGDFVDLIPLSDDKLLFYLADVSGHGASSALVTVLLKNMTNRLLRGLHNGESQLLEDPEKMLQHFNREVLLTSLGKHLTMFIGVIDTQRGLLDYAVGGHHPLPVLVQQGEAAYLSGRGMPVGLFEQAQYDRVQLPLATSFDLILFSDGILELIEGDNLEEKEQNLLGLCQHADVSPSSILEKLQGEQGANPDDVAIMMVSRRC